MRPTTNHITIFFFNPDWRSRLWLTGIEANRWVFFCCLISESKLCLADTVSVYVRTVRPVGRLTPSVAGKGNHSVMQPGGSSPGRCPQVEEADWLWLSWCGVLLLSENTRRIKVYIHRIKPLGSLKCFWFLSSWRLLQYTASEKALIMQNGPYCYIIGSSLSTH